MKWQAKILEAITIDDKGLRTLLKREDGPALFAESLAERYRDAIRQKMDDGVPFLIELRDSTNKTMFGMTGED